MRIYWYVGLLFFMGGSCFGAMPKSVTPQEQQKLPQSVIVACWNGDAQWIKWFIEEGGSPDAIDGTGLTLFARACARGNTPVVKLLIAQKASLELVSQGKTPLMWASFLGHAPVVKLLAEHKVPLESQDEEGSTALMLAIQGGESECVEELLQAGAKTGAVGKDGLNARKIARLNKNEQIITLLNKYQKKTQKELRKKQSVEKEGYELVPPLSGAALKEFEAQKNAPTIWDWCVFQ